MSTIGDAIDRISSMWVALEGYANGDSLSIVRSLDDPTKWAVIGPCDRTEYADSPEEALVAYGDVLAKRCEDMFKKPEPWQKLMADWEGVRVDFEIDGARK